MRRYEIAFYIHGYHEAGMNIRLSGVKPKTRETSAATRASIESGSSMVGLKPGYQDRSRSRCETGSR
ncbi:hypothetical protein K437DRAFT_260210 [Tilletiaria anomala UBC 951]|uniref:Uncharacterized protein n=1 Tax=Tilletiaria anomala (strain ATCC 24038 / CBS 436.72 / UBC 951) TaxID=1037660 RepID=A0A066V3T3_TILAU|nr:uncharacterized protein K437DRAFT_260210 [Tilletiaria anomala UBC 951]KDN36136.1 hypothetical protein K437DRAFT_260210 [Tilletiaria anomala UBC 951]